MTTVALVVCGTLERDAVSGTIVRRYSATRLLAAARSMSQFVVVARDVVVSRVEFVASRMTVVLELLVSLVSSVSSELAIEMKRIEMTAAAAAVVVEVDIEVAVLHAEEVVESAVRYRGLLSLSSSSNSNSNLGSGSVRLRHRHCHCHCHLRHS